MDAVIPVSFIVGLEGGQHAQFDSRGVTVLLNRTDDFNSHELVGVSIAGLDDPAKRSLAEHSSYHV